MDSGGPLVHKDRLLIGIVSSSPLGCDETVAPSVYTRVTSYIPFITNAVNNIVSEDMRSAIKIIKDGQIHMKQDVITI